ncbi:lysophospholipase [Schlesneria sp.]|uniref:alpha/beta hydrolase n=1 Tax=Schlesneria sp. TaxID=2762018 RepID=UPI002F068543
MRLETQVVTATDAVELFVRSYLPDQRDPRRVLYWVHGLGEHGGRHEHVAKCLTEQGWSMIVADLRGHGGSGGTRTHVASFDQYVDDIVLIWERLGLTASPPTLLGHSMGGLVVVRAVQTGKVAPASLVLSSPLLGLKLRVNPVAKLLGRAVVRFLPTLRFSNGIDPANMTTDSEFAAARRSDPLINKTVTAGWFFAMQKAKDAAIRDAARVSLPLLALQGGNDRTTDPEALAKWFERARSQPKQLLLLPDHIHELFFESDWQQTTLQMLNWLESIR